MAKAGRGQTRRDSKCRVLRPGESVRADGKYQYKYHIDGKPHFVYSWKQEPTDKLPKGKKPCLSLRELEKQVNTDLDLLVNIVDGQMIVCELVDRYLKTKTGVRQSTKQGYVTVQRLLAKEAFGKKTIRSVKTSDAKLFLIKLQQEDGKSYSSIHTIRGVLRPAFQMAVDDDILVKNPFGFQLAGVLVNDAVTREAVTKEQMRKFLKFVHDDVVYCKYYEVVYILFHTGMRISEFCGLTLKDIDLENRTVNIDHQLQRTSDMRYIIETTKTDAGTRVLPITEDVAQMFQAIIEDRNAPKVEEAIDGYSGFLFYDDNGMPLVAMHWQHRFNHMVGRYNDIYRVQMPNITPHVCRHTYCSNMAKSGMNLKTLQYLMGHSDISVTMNVYTHIGFDDAEEELKRMIQKALTAKGEFARGRRISFRMKNLEEYQDLCDAIDIRKLTVWEYVRRHIRPEIREASNGQLAFLFFTTSIPENSLVLLDEPENSLSPGKVLELADYLQASVRLGTQLILSTHSPLLLAMEGAAVYDFDSDPVCRRAWYELESVRIYQRFFQEKSNLFDSGGDGSRK